MGLKRLLEKRYIRQNVHVPVEQLIETVTNIRKLNEDLVICPQPTGYNWKGIYNATHGLFAGNVLDLPQYYSSAVYSDIELKQLGECISSLSYNNVIFSGFLPYFEQLIRSLKGGSKVGVIYHGFLSELSSNPFQTEVFNSLINLSINGTIHKIAFNKKGLPETLRSLRNIPSYHILLKTPVNNPVNSPGYTDGKIHIGVMVNNSFRKNLHNQVAGALMINNSMIHVSEVDDLLLFNDPKRIIKHGGSLDHSEYIGLLAANDLNMYVTYSESWGLVATESMAQGVPCLVSDNSGIMDYDEDLRNFLVVREFDNSSAIARQAQMVLENMEVISGRCKDYIGLLNSKADQSLKIFLDA